MMIISNLILVTPLMLILADKLHLINREVDFVESILKKLHP